MWLWNIFSSKQTLLHLNKLLALPLYIHNVIWSHVLGTIEICWVLYRRNFFIFFAVITFLVHLSKYFTYNEFVDVRSFETTITLCIAQFDNFAKVNYFDEKMFQSYTVSSSFEETFHQFRSVFNFILIKVFWLIIHNLCS